MYQESIMNNLALSTRGLFGTAILMAVIAVLGLASTIQAQPGNDSIVAGKGVGPLAVGAKHADIVRAFGVPDGSGKIDHAKPDTYATYFAKGFVVEYENEVVTVIRFVGDASLYADGKTKFAPFFGMPDKGLRWRSSIADVIKVYGKPVERKDLKESNTDEPLTDLTYDDAIFRFKMDRLFQISVMKASKNP